VLTIPFVSAAQDLEVGARFKAKLWTTARISPERVLGQSLVYAIVVIRGNSARVVYRSTPSDLELSEPVMSRDGSRLAFFKTWRDGDEVRRAIWSIDVEGMGSDRITDLEPPAAPIRGAIVPSSLAWSPDNQYVAFLGVQIADSIAAQNRAGLDRFHLNVVNVVSRASRRIRHVDNADVDGPMLTNQAWGPGSGSLVISLRRHILVVSVAQPIETNLGPGLSPSWSSDGESIVAQETPNESSEGDYVIIPVKSPTNRRILLKNPRRAVFRVPLGTNYFGIPLWTPDGGHILLSRHRRFFEGGDAYAVEVASGRTSGLEGVTLGVSIGGIP
jgi:dipeptidyl aminopeptidase/acylaminoacyl peptidase